MLVLQNLKYYFGNLPVQSIYLGNSIVYTSTTVLPAASGGVITTFISGGDTYYVHTFTQNDVFTLFQPLTADYLIVAGGGGSNFDVSGGGGAGGLLTGTTILTAVNQPYSIVVGLGGAPGYDAGVIWATNGGNSIFNSLTAIGGGAGADYNGRPAQNGGSGGGGNSVVFSGGTGTSSPIRQGYNGGNGPIGLQFSSGGGGGADAPGQAGGSIGISSTGGAGLSSNITGTPIYYAGGGSGGRDTGSTVPIGSLGGGGSGQVRGSGNAGTITGNNVTRTGNLLTITMNAHPYQVNDYGYINSTEITPQFQIFRVINRSTNQFQAISDISGNFTGTAPFIYTMYRSTAQDGINGLGGGAGGTSDREIRGRFGGSGIVIVRYKQPSVVVTDPYFSNVSLLLHMDGTAGSQIFTDSSSNNFPLSVFGQTQVNTSIKMFGSGSALFDGSGDYLRVNSSLAFALGSNFTIESWVYPTIMSPNDLTTIVDLRDSGTQHGTAVFLESSTGKVFFYDGPANNVLLTNSTIPLNTWTHIAAVRNGTTWQVYINGVLDSATYTSSSNLDAARACFIGTAADGPGNTRNFTGYIDDLRITKGITRYTSNFTPPTQAFPNS